MRTRENHVRKALVCQALCHDTGLSHHAIHLCCLIQVFAIKLHYSSARLPAIQPKRPHRHARMS